MANGSCMAIAGVLLVSSGLLVASLIPRSVDIIYIAVGLLAGKLNHALSSECQYSDGIFFKYSVVN